MRMAIIIVAVLLSTAFVPPALGNGYDFQPGSVAEPAGTCDSSDPAGSCHSRTAGPTHDQLIMMQKKIRHGESSDVPALPLDESSEKTLEHILEMEAEDGEDAAAKVAEKLEEDDKEGRSTSADVTDNRETIHEAIEALERSMPVEEAAKKGVLVKSKMLEEINGEEDTPEQAVSSEEETAYEGDMMVEPSDVPALMEATRSGHMTGLRLWPTGKPIKFCFASDIADKSKQAFLDAVEHYHKLIPCLKFELTGHKSGASDDARSQKKCDADEAIFVQSSMNSGCSSAVGSARRRTYNKFGLVQLQLKSPGCDNMGTAAHEIGHALGMSHEQSRPDRDEYVQILWDNIQAGKEHNFKKKIESQIAAAKPTDQKYDFLSLMHYSPGSFGGGQNTIEAKAQFGDEAQNLMGQRFGLTQADAKQIASMYGCLGEQEQFKVCSIDMDHCTAGPCTCHEGFKFEKTLVTSKGTKKPCSVCVKKQCPPKRTSTRRREYTKTPCGCASPKKMKTYACRRRSSNPETCYGCADEVVDRL